MLQRGDRVWVKRFCCGWNACGGSDDCLLWSIKDGWAMRNGDRKGTIVDDPYAEPLLPTAIYRVALDRYHWYHLWRPRIRVRMKHLEPLSPVELLAEV